MKPNKTLIAALCLSSLLAFTGAFAATDGEPPHWDYSDPTAWGYLDEAYAMCKDGQKQSPIDIQRTREKEVGELEFDYNNTPLEILNNGHTLQVNYAPGSSLKINHKKYRLLQFHFHTPSEHKVGGETAPMEMHFVHADENGSLAVVGVMMNYGEENHSFAKILDNAPHSKGTVVVAGESLNGQAFMPRHKDEADDFYNYSGSLTTPPCSEGVRWFVLKKRISVSHEQVEEFAEFVHHGNARPVQGINDRTVYDNDD